jgi:hypothetical protein
MKNVAHYFEVARMREQIRRLRATGAPPPWTADPILGQWRFTNVHRENDKTTVWFRENVRSKVSGLRAVEACLIFRWFNRIETGERITDLLVEGWDTEEARRRLKGVAPLVTGAYMVHSPIGFNKLDGLLYAIDEARPHLRRWWESPPPVRSLQHTFEHLVALYNMGEFSAGEVVIDLRYTDVLDKAPDINTWTVAGPGCTRGLGWLMADDPAHYRYGSTQDQATMLGVMWDLLEASRDPRHWPTEWEPWELHECEMWACEYAKYRSAQTGARLKRRFAVS